MTIEREIHILRETGGFAALPDWGLLEITGADAARLLHARSTNEVQALADGQGLDNAFLDRTAHIQALFSLYRLNDSLFLVAERQQLPTIVEQIEFYQFREQATITNRSEEGEFLAVQGPHSKGLLADVTGCRSEFSAGADAVPATVSGVAVLVLRKSVTGEDGYFIWFPAGSAAAVESFRRSAEKAGFTSLSPEALEVARIEAGLPRFGVDAGGEELITDAALEQSCVSYTKGCYIGQEIVARIKTYGAPRKGLVGLILDVSGAAPPPPGSVVMVDGKSVGSVRSSTQSPTLGKTIALAYVDREHRVPEQVVAVALATGQAEPARVAMLPLYQPQAASKKARALYEQGLALFAADREEEAIAALRRALKLDPLLADAYESLGVILSRRDELDEAIALMKKLAELDPESVMAHANLSVFYLQAGDKETAEEEKAVAMSLRMQKLAREAAAEHKEAEGRDRSAEEEEAKRQEIEERMSMFRQVLALDSEDYLANSGLGNLYCEAGEFEKAIPYLQKALAVNRSHTVAYLALGNAYEQVGRLDDAAETYRQGVTVASRRGDMTPLKEMQSKLAQLQSAAP